jgi:hypothetical protein
VLAGLVGADHLADLDADRPGAGQPAGRHAGGEGPDDGLTWAARQKLQPGAIPYYSSGCGRRSPYRPR